MYGLGAQPPARVRRRLRRAFVRPEHVSGGLLDPARPGRKPHAVGSALRLVGDRAERERDRRLRDGRLAGGSVGRRLNPRRRSPLGVADPHQARAGGAARGGAHGGPADVLGPRPAQRAKLASDPRGTDEVDERHGGRPPPALHEYHYVNQTDRVRTGSAPSESRRIDRLARGAAGRGTPRGRSTPLLQAPDPRRPRREAAFSRAASRMLAVGESRANRTNGR